MVENSRGQLLLHKRAPGMRLYPSCWDVSAGGHVDVTPDYLETAKIELFEEVGIKDVPLAEIGYGYYEDVYPGGMPAKRFIKFYSATYDGEPGALAADEVVEVRWCTRVEAARLC